MPISDEEERDLKVALMRADLALKQKQSFWETPRNIVLIVASAAAVAGVLGFKLGQNASGPPTQIIFEPGSITVPPSAK